MTERPHPVRVFIDVADPWARRVVRDALAAHGDIRFVASAAAADVRLVSEPARPALGSRSRRAAEVPGDASAAQGRADTDGAMPADTSPSLLSDREREVLQALSEGLSNAAIGARLGISRSTVKFHLTAVFEKLGVHRRAEAVAMGIRHGDVLL
jgi:DNA-binding CsgD family transcriptional regulator